MNKPNGKSTQLFQFKGNEAKHAIGARHSKRKEFQCYPGIYQVNMINKEGETITYKNEKCYAFMIKGQPLSVDQLIIDISRWLGKCSIQSELEKQNYSELVLMNEQKNPENEQALVPFENKFKESNKLKENTDEKVFTFEQKIIAELPQADDDDDTLGVEKLRQLFENELVFNTAEQLEMYDTDYEYGHFYLSNSSNLLPIFKNEQANQLE